MLVANSVAFRGQLCLQARRSTSTTLTAAYRRGVRTPIGREVPFLVDSSGRKFRFRTIASASAEERPHCDIATNLRFETHDDLVRALHQLKVSHVSGLHKVRFS